MADEVKSVKDEMNGKSELLPAKWNRFTVADGDWMQSKTLNPLTARDDFLAEQIDKSTSDWQDALSSESATRYSDDQYLSASISSLSGEFYTFSADDYLPTVTTISSNLNNEIRRSKLEDESLNDRVDNEITNRQTEDEKLQKQIDKLQAATDVIAVFGTYPEFTAASAGSWQEQVTDNDFIKILRDSAYNPTGDEDADTRDDDYYQVYYQWHISAHDGWDGWSAIGNLDPYYSVAEIDEYKEDVADDFESLSATVANTYLSANGTDISAGKNLDVVIQSNNPRVAFKTKDEVSFTNVSATGFSGTNLSGVTKHDTIDNLFGSAHSGAEASAWINDNTARLDIQAGYGISTGTNENGNIVIGIQNNGCDYAAYGLALGENSTARGAINGPNAFAFGDYCYANGANAFAAGCHSTAGKFAVAMGYNNVATGDYSLALGYNSTADRAYSVVIGQGLSSTGSITLGKFNEYVEDAQVVIGDGRDQGHDVTARKNILVIKNDKVSAADFSAGNVSLSSLTNISAFGNGITNTATFNLSAVKLSAGQGIGFKNDTNGVLSISAEGRAYTGENYVKVDNSTKKIGLSGNLVGSAESGQSAYDWITTKSATLQAGPGIGLYSAGPNILGISAEGTKVSAGGNIQNPTEYTTNVNLSAAGGVQFVTANNDVLGIKTSTMEYSPFNHSTYSDMTSFKINAVALQSTQQYESVVMVNDRVYGFLLPEPDSLDHLKIPVARHDGVRGYYYLDNVTAAIGNYVSAANQQHITVATATSLPSPLEENVYYLI